MITLPDWTPLSAGPLRGFAVSASLLLGVGAGLAASGGDRRGRRRGAVVGAATFLVGAVPGLLRPAVARSPYRCWARMSRGVASAATSYTAWVTHTTALPALPGWEREREDPGWEPRGGQPGGGSGEGGGARVLRSGRWWLRDQGPVRGDWLAVCLATLRWLQPPDDEDGSRAPAGDNYSLY